MLGLPRKSSTALLFVVLSVVFMARLGSLQRQALGMLLVAIVIVALFGIIAIAQPREPLAAAVSFSKVESEKGAANVTTSPLTALTVIQNE